MNTRFMCKRIRANNGLIGLDGVARDLRHQTGSTHDLGGINSGIALKNILADLDRHHNLLKAGITRPLTKTVNRALHLTRTV